MPEITNLSVSYSRKVQLEQFEPIQHSVEVEAELSDGEDADEQYDALAELAEDMVERQLARRITQKKLADDEDDEDADD